VRRFSWQSYRPQCCKRDAIRRLPRHGGADTVRRKRKTSATPKLPGKGLCNQRAGEGSRFYADDAASMLPDTPLMEGKKAILAG